MQDSVRQGLYSPFKGTHTEKVPVMEGPDPKKAGTSHAERRNLATRMQYARLTRLKMPSQRCNRTCGPRTISIWRKCCSPDPE